MRHDGSIQFNLPPPPTPPKPPAWVEPVLRWIGKLFRPIGRFLNWIGSFLPDAPVARIILWTVIAVGAAALLWALYNRLRHGEWSLKLPRLATPQDVASEEDWAPD